MVIKVMDTGRTERLSYRTWDGIKYGQDEAEDIVRQHSNVPFDRSAQAFIMSHKDFTFWKQYFKHLERDEQSLRGLYQKYHAADVEKILKEELRIAGDDPARHHKARLSAIRQIKERAQTRTSKDLKSYHYDELMSIRFSARHDGDIIDILRDAERKKVSKGSEVKRYIRLGLQHEKEKESRLQDDIDTLKSKGWL